MRNVKEKVHTTKFLATLAEMHKSILQAFPLSEVRLHPARDEISIAADMGPERGGYQDIFKGTQERVDEWKIEAHPLIADGLATYLLLK